ncbi:MAG: hypothetical protein DELT_01042 [Desulfovibrio sp.]
MKLVCLGDSLTYGYEVRRAAVWTRLFQNATGVETRNKGVNGITTAGMLNRFSLDVTAEQPDIVLIMGGANDILAHLGPDEAEKNLAEMLARANRAGIRALLGIPIPFCPPIREDWASMANFPAMTPVYDAFAERLLLLAKTTGTDTVNFRSGLAAHIRETGLPAAAFYGDGIHLNEEGHRVFAAILAATFSEIVL